MHRPMSDRPAKSVLVLSQLLVAVALVGIAVAAALLPLYAPAVAVALSATVDALSPALAPAAALAYFTAGAAQ